MARITVFGAGAMGTAMAIHLARAGHDAALWAGPHDAGVLDALLVDRRHPALPEHLPESLVVHRPEEIEAAGRDLEIGVMAASSVGTRSLAREVAGAGLDPSLVVGVAKGLEPGSRRRMSEVLCEEIGHDRVVSVGGPGLASELAESLPTAAVFAAADGSVAEEAAVPFRTRDYRIVATDDLLGVEYCTVAKNVAAIGLGILDGLGKAAGFAYRNAKAALFAQALAELTELVVALGGRPETAGGLAGLGDTLVTSLGGRNRLYGELIGEGVPPEPALTDLVGRGMTVEGVESAVDVRLLAAEAGLDLPFHEQIHRILFEGAPAASLLLLPERMKA